MNYIQEYQKLRDSLPRLATGLVSNENCDFCNYADQNKNCYLTVSCYRSEKCINGRSVFFCNFCIDCDFVEKCELCYECLDCSTCFNCNYCQDCGQCSECEYCFDCRGCQNCFGCANLRQKQFYIFNKKYSEKEYFQKLEEARKNNKFQNIKLEIPHKSIIGEKNENSTGNHIFNNKNVQHCFDTKGSQDCAYGYELFNCEDCVDIMIGEFAKWDYDCVSAYKLENSNFCYNCWESSDLEYCEQCRQCRDCLFCVNLYHKQYYILNQPFSRERYFQEKELIIAEMKAQGIYGNQHITSTYPFEDSLAAC